MNPLSVEAPAAEAAVVEDVDVLLPTAISALVVGVVEDAVEVPVGATEVAPLHTVGTVVLEPMVVEEATVAVAGGKLLLSLCRRFLSSTRYLVPRLPGS